MKFIIVGLGNYGSSLATKLSALGHEVIGADNNMQKVDAIKDQITHAVCLDSTDQQAMSTLPIKEADVVVVGIGEDFGASVMATAIFKQHNAKRLISRSISPLHQTVLEAIGVDDIANPEQESADRWAKKLDLQGVINSFNLSEDYNLIEATVPKRYIGKTIEQADFRGKYNVNILTIKRMKETKNILGLKQRKPVVVGVVSPQTVLEPEDIIVLFGRIGDIERLLE